MSHTENTYRHPSEGQPFAVRFLIASLAVGFLLLVCSAPRAEASTGPVHFSAPCRVVAGEADANDGRLDRIAARHGGIDYSGSLHGGRWSVNDTGKVFGYSREEDARVYSTARCARVAPAYLNL